MTRLRKFAPVKRCQQCGQREGKWEDVTDSHTGTAYMRCKRCGAYYKASAVGYVDWSIGVFMSGQSYVGSDWTQRPGKGYFGRSSDVTND